MADKSNSSSHHANNTNSTSSNNQTTNNTHNVSIQLSDANRHPKSISIIKSTNIREHYEFKQILGT